MLFLLRVLFGAALLYEMVQGAKSAPGATEAGDLTGAFYMAVCVGLAILNALVWAPYLGAKVSGPMTEVITGGHYIEQTNWVLRMLRWCDARGYRRLTNCLCFWEGVRHPNSPGAFVVGFKSAKPGSWLEKVFAREVFRFNHTQHCVEAYQALKRHGIDPRPHSSQEVNVVLFSLERPVRAEATVMAVPTAAPAAPLKRNPRISLFKPAKDAPRMPASAQIQTEPEAAAQPDALPKHDTSHEAERSGATVQSDAP